MRTYETFDEAGTTYAELIEMSMQSHSEVHSDYTNPAYLFSTTHQDLLVAIANHRVDVVTLAKIQLASRGLSSNGKQIPQVKAHAEYEALKNQVVVR